MLIINEDKWRGYYEGCEDEAEGEGEVIETNLKSNLRDIGISVDGLESEAEVESAEHAIDVMAVVARVQRGLL